MKIKLIYPIKRIFHIFEFLYDNGQPLFYLSLTFKLLLGDFHQFKTLTFNPINLKK